MAESGEYCPDCGQKFTDGKVSFGELLADLFEAIFNFDSKIFRTIGHLFLPGKLTTEYFKGRHKRYVSPLRLFLVMTVIHFAVLSFIGFKNVAELFQAERQKEREAAYQAIFLEKLDSVSASVEDHYGPSRRLSEALDSLQGSFRDTRFDSSTIGYLTVNDDGTQLTFHELKVSQQELELKSAKEIAGNYSNLHWLERIQIQQFVKLRGNPTSFFQFLLGKFTWMVLLMMPALALILKFLYIRRHRYYIEHLIFSFHYHAFAFLIVSVGILLDQGFEAFAMAALFLVLIYLFFAMRRVYGQGLLKTFVKYTILNFSYIFVFLLFLLGTMVVSAAIY